MYWKRLIVWSLLFIFVFSLWAQVDQSWEQADAFTDQEEYEKANLIYESLSKIFLEKQQYNEYVSAKMAISNNLLDLEEEKKAVNLLNTTLQLAASKLQNDSLLALVYHRLGTAIYLGLSDDELAIINWQKALSIRSNIFPKNHLDIIKMHRNIGNGFLNLEQFEIAKNHFQQAADLHLTRTNKDPILLAKTYNDLGNAYLVLEDYNKAEKYSEVALTEYKRIFIDEPWELYFAYENIFDLYSIKKEYSKIVKSQKEIIETYEQLDDKIEDDYIKIANCYNNLGLGYSLLDSLAQALQYYQESMRINREFVENNTGALAINHNNIANIYHDQGKLDLALTNINLAIDLDKKSGNQTGLATNLNDQSIILLSQGRGESALESVESAISLIAPSADDGIILDKPLLVDILGQKLKILQVLGKKDISYLKRTIPTIQQIRTLINQLRLTFESDQSKAYLSEKARVIYENALEANIALYRQTKNEDLLNNVFSIIEEAKAMIVIDARSEENAIQKAGIPISLIERENSLKRQVSILEKQLFTKPENSTAIQKKLILTNHQLENLIDTLKDQYPKYAELKYAAKKILPTDIQLSSNQTLIEFFIGTNIIYSLVLGDKGIKLIEIPKDFPLNNWISQLQKGLLTYHLEGLRSKKQYQAYADTLSKTAHQLYKKLIEPIAEAYPLTEELIIIPDGVLGYIPFDILIKTPPESSIAFGVQDYLINDYQISYCYSATLLKEMRDKIHEPTDANLIAFAPVFPEGNRVGDNRSELAIIRSGLTALHYNIPEVEAINKIIKGKILMAEEAIESNFLDLAPDYKIIHLSTHGKANDEIGDYAYLAFTEIPDTIENEILYNRDLYNLQLNADMVVLSACETGIGELQKGEGIISLARGFSYAGAKSIITTLWSVNDAKTKELMESFYTHLKASLPKDKALRQAKLDFIDTYSHDAHPFFWAAFIPVGDMSPIELEANIPWLLIGGISLFLLVFLIKRYS